MTPQIPTVEFELALTQEDLNTLLDDQFGYLTEETARQRLLQTCSDIYSEEELATKFIVDKIEAPYVYVKDRETGTEGTLLFIRSPRLYFDFTPIKNE